MFLKKSFSMLALVLGMSSVWAGEDGGRFSADVATQVAEAEAKGATESTNVYRKRLLKLKALLQEKEARYLKVGIEEREAAAANGDLALLEAFEWVEIRKLKTEQDCESAIKTLRGLEDPQSEGAELQTVEHQVMGRLIRPLCGAKNARKK